MSQTAKKGFCILKLREHVFNMLLLWQRDLQEQRHSADPEPGRKERVSLSDAVEDALLFSTPPLTRSKSKKARNKK